MDAVVIIVGDEILQGHTRDANLHWLAQRLDEMGHYVERGEIIHDRLDVVVPALQRAARDADVVLVTGGLGPTHDDRTRDAFAEAFDLELEVQDAYVDALAAAYRQRFGDGDPPEAHVVEAGRRMCSVPAGSRLLENRVGAALGFALHVEEAHVIAMPGVPREMQDMFEEQVADDLVPDEGGRAVAREVLVDLPEAAFSDQLAQLQERHPDVAVGSYPLFDEPRVRVRVRGELKLVEDAVADLRRTMADHLVEPADG